MIGKNAIKKPGKYIKKHSPKEEGSQNNLSERKMTHTILYVKQTYKFLSFGLFFLVGQAHASLSQDFIDQSEEAIAASCGSSIAYGLNRPFDTAEQAIYGGNPVQDEYIETMNCLVNDAMAGLQKQANAEAEKATQKYSQTGDFGPKTKEIESKCSKKIPAPSFKSECPEGSEFSSCKLNEQVFSEWCGYNMYLLGKMNHSDRLILKTPEELAPLSTIERNRLINNRKNALQKEKDKAEVAAEQVKVFFKAFEAPYEKSAATNAANQHLKEFNDKLTLVRIAMSTWKAKFVNAQAKFCKQ